MSTAGHTLGELTSGLPSWILAMETDEALHEPVNGERAQMPPISIRAVTVVNRLTGLIDAFAKTHRLEEAFSEMLISLLTRTTEDGIGVLTSSSSAPPR